MRFVRVIAILSIFILSIRPLSAQHMVSASDDKGLEKSVRYDVSSFTDTRDRKLEDVMKKMPGLSNNDWGFWYNGMYVEKFYVNGQDILGDNTSAVLNMKPEDVDYVEIIENHVTQKVMKGIKYSDNAAINVVLKDSAHSGWSGAVKAGGGISPSLYNLDLSAMNLGDITNSVLLKADNTGLEFGGGGNYGGYKGLPQFLNVSPSLAPLSDQRVRFNNSLRGDVGTNIRLSDDYSLNIQLSYDTDKIEAKSFDETTYYLDKGEMVVDETGEDAISSQKNLSANLILLSNTEKRFLQNNLSFNSTWRDVDKLITGSFPSDQNVITAPLKVSNSLEYKYPLGKNILSIDSSIEFRSRPEKLVIDRIADIFSQHIDSQAANADVYATYSMNFGNVNASLKAGGFGYTRKLNMEMSGAEEMDDSLNESSLNNYMLTSEASMTYISDNLQIQASLPFKWGYYQLVDHIGDDNMKGSRTYFSPSLSTKYQVSNELAFTGNVSSNQSEVGRGRMYPGLVFKDFRFASRGIPVLRGDNEKELEGGVSYRKAESSFFVSGSISRTWSRPAFINVMDFSSNYIISGYEEAPEGYRDITTEIDGNISKGIGALKGKIGLGIWGEFSTSSIIRNRALIPYSYRSISLSPNINGRLFSWLNLIYSLNINWNHAVMEGEDTSSYSKGYTQNMELIFSPWEKFNFSFLAEHYYTEFTDDDVKHLVLSDFKAEYALTPMWVLMAAVTNILNQDTYNYTLVDNETFSKSYTSFGIRPRNVLLSLYHKF